MAIGIVVLLLLGTTVAVLRLAFSGEALGARVASILNDGMRGKIEVGSIEWELGALQQVVTGGWVPVTIRDVELRDDKNEIVLRAPKITAEIDIHALMFGRNDFVLRNIVIDGGWVKLKQTTEPYPLHAYDRTAISLMSAFYPKNRPSFGAGIYASSPPPVFDLQNFQIRNLDVEVWWAPSDDDNVFATVITLNDLNADGFMYMDPTDPLVARMYFGLTPSAPSGRLELFRDSRPGKAAEYTIDLVDINIARLTQIPMSWPRSSVATSLELDLTARTVQGASLHLFGDLKDYWARPYDGSWNFTAEVDNLGPTLSAVVAPELRGNRVAGTFTLTGPYVAAPRIGWRNVTGLEYDLALSKEEAPIRLILGELNGSVDFVNDTGKLERSVALVAEGDGVGKIQIDGTFDLAPYQPHVTIAITEPLDLGRFVDRWLPPSIGRSLGHHLSGSFILDGDPAVAIGLEQIDLQLRTSRDDGRLATRISGGEIVAEDELERFTLRADRFGRALTIATGGTTASITGTTSTRTETVDVTVVASSSDLGTWLRRFELPPLAKRADRAVITVRGELTSPEISVDATLREVMGLGDLSLTATKQGNNVELSSVRTAGFGGELAGSGSIRLSPTGGAPYLSKLQLSGRNLSAQKLAELGGLGSSVRGTIDSADLTAKGSLRLTDPSSLLALASGTLRTRTVTIAGEEYRDVGVCINRPQDLACRRSGSAVHAAEEQSCLGATTSGGVCLAATALRTDGGVVDAMLSQQSAKKGGALAGVISIQELPARALAALMGQKIQLGGSVSTVLRVGGDASAPTVSGAIDLVRGWVGNTFVGDVRLGVVDSADSAGTIALAGTALGGQIIIDASVGLAAPYPIDIHLRGHRIEVDAFVDLQAMLGAPYPVHGWATGAITLHAELGAKIFAPVAWVELQELSASIDYVDGEGRPLPLRVSAIPQTAGRAAVSLRATPTSVELACRRRDENSALVPIGANDTDGPCPIVLATPAGSLTIGGNAIDGKLALAADGLLDLALLQPLLAGMFDDVTGTAELHGKFAGDLATPTYNVSIDLNDVAVRPTGQETVVRIPGGFIKLDNKTIGLSDVRLRVDDTYLGNQSQLSLRGLVLHDGLTPTTWSLIIDGELAGKMLLAVAPGLFTEATGVAVIEDAITVSGTGASPDISGSISFDTPQPLTVTPRGLRRELAFTGGSLDIESSDDDEGARTYALTLERIKGNIDGEGRLDAISGTVSLRDGVPVEADVTVDASALSFRIPRTLDLVLNANRLRLQVVDENAPIRVTGAVEVVSGKFIKNLDLSSFRQPEAASTSVKPFWEEYPSLGTAALDLSVRVSTMKVESNFGELSLVSNDLQITGTPRDPRFGGQITVNQGRLHIPGTRATFTRTSGAITFTPNARLLEGTPSLAIDSEADYRDPSGQDNLITLTLRGSYPNVTWDLSTSTGLTRDQTFSLILFGRTSQQLRASLGDDAIGKDPTRLDPSGDDVTFTDQLLKDIAGDWISSQIGDQLRQVIPIDVARFYFTTGGVGFHGEQKVLDNVNLVFDAEQTVRGRNINVRGELKTPSRLSVQLGYVNKTYSDQTDDDISDLQLKAVFRWLLF